MATINSLLNPVMDDKTPDSDVESRDETSTHDSQTSTGSGARANAHDKPTRKKQKICKDAAVFKPGTVQGECRYPPYEEQDDLLLAEHQKYGVYPVGEIALYPRHIPYNSEKKLFWEKTGRESFEGEDATTDDRLVLSVMLTLSSFSISIQDAWRVDDLHYALGLQHWSGAHHAIVQVSQLLQGMQKVKLFFF